MATYDEYKINQRVRAPQLQDLFDDIMDITSGHDHDGANSKSVSGGAPSDGSVTNAKLHSDVKVGSLAAFTTTAKTSVQGAVNELDAAIGDVASLTTSASTAVTAVNELDAEIGNVATLTTTSKVLVGAINELDVDNSAFATKTGAETLTNKTITSPTITTMLINDGDTGLTVTSSNQTNAAPTATIPDIADAADTFVMADTAQTLTNKTVTDLLIDDTDAGCTITSSDQTAADATATIPNMTTSDSFAMVATAQTLTNKTVTDLLIDDTDAGCTITSSDQTAADATATIPNMTTSDTFAMLATAGTLTNKTIDGDDNTISDIAASSLKSTTGADTAVCTGTAGTTNYVAKWNADGDLVDGTAIPTGAIVGSSDSQTLTNKTLTTPAITSGVLTTPKIVDGDQNVTITSADQTDSGATITIPDCVDSADSFVLDNTVATLTLKTLTSPKINEDVAVSTTATLLNLAGTKATYGARFMYMGTPELDDVDQVVTSANMKVGTYTIAASPDVPRVVTVVHTQVGGVSDTLGTIDLVGTDAADAACTETITVSDQATATGLKAFKTVTSATGVGWVINTTEDTITIGSGPALGLPEKITVGTTTALAYLAATPEAVSAVGSCADVPNSTVTLTSALDGTAVHILTNGA